MSPCAVDLSPTLVDQGLGVRDKGTSNEVLGLASVDLGQDTEESSNGFRALGPVSGASVLRPISMDLGPEVPYSVSLDLDLANLDLSKLDLSL